MKTIGCVRYFPTSYDLDAVTEEYISLSREEAAEAPVPMMFISFPSAKDSTYNERYPGK